MLSWIRPLGWNEHDFSPRAMLGTELVQGNEYSCFYRPIRPTEAFPFSFLSRWFSADPENEGRSEACRSAVRLCWVATGLISPPVPSKGTQWPSRYHPLLRFPGQARCSG